MQPEQEQPDGSKRPAYQCSFCGKEHHEVKRLIAGKVRHRCILRPVPCYHQEMFLKVRTQILDIDKGNRIAQSCFASRANTKQEPGFNRNPI